MLTQGSVLRPQPWAGETQLRQSCCCLRSGQLGVLPIVYCACEGDDINTKNRGGGWRLRLGVDGGADCRKTSFPPCRLHHPHRHAGHDAIRRDGKKSGLRPFKKSGFRRYKNSHSCNPDYHAGHNTYGLIIFSRREPGFFYRRRRTFCICSFSACLWAGATGWGGEYPRACSRVYFRSTLTHRAKS